MAKVVLKYQNEKTSAVIAGNTSLMVDFWRLTLQTVGLISIYFSLSIGLTFYQRWLLKDFHYPLSVTTTHLVIKLFLSGLCRILWTCYTGRSRVCLSWRNYLEKVSPTGLASGLDIGFSNWGLELVTVSLYTMTKSTSIIFILGFAILFKLEKKAWSLVMIVLMIALGLFLFTYKATQFDMGGFLLILSASFLSGLRWTLAQLIMQKSKLGLENPIDMVYHVQPWMIVSILPFAVGFEGRAVSENWRSLSYDNLSIISCTALKVATGAFIAFAMEISEFVVVTKTSSLTLSVACVFKEVITLVLAVLWNGDQISLINFTGLLICVGGIIFHIIHKVSVASKNRFSDQESENDAGELTTSIDTSDLKVPLLSESISHTSIQSEKSDDEENESGDDILFNVLQHHRDSRR